METGIAEPPPTQSTISYDDTPAAKEPGASYPAMKRFTVLAGILVPITVLPYLLMRRKTQQLRREIETLKGSIWSMEVHYGKQLGAIRRELEAQQRMKPMVVNMKHDLEDFQEQVGNEQRDAEERRQLQVRSLAEEIRQSKARIDAQAVAASALGMTLADMAAFVNEVELSMSLPSQQARIDRLRRVGLHLQNNKGADHAK